MSLINIIYHVNIYIFLNRDMIIRSEINVKNIRNDKSLQNDYNLYCVLEKSDRVIIKILNPQTFKGTKVSAGIFEK